MPQSLSRILIHLVFGTKNRERVLTPAVRTELHPYLAGTLDNLEYPNHHCPVVSTTRNLALPLIMRS